MTNYFKILLATSVVGMLAAEEFSPINFEERGFSEPALEAVVGGHAVKKILDQSLVLAVLRLSNERKDLQAGLSIKIHGFYVSEARMLPQAQAEKLMTEIKNPLNYGEGQQEVKNLPVPPKFSHALETTNGDLFLRIYVDDTITYCLFYCQDGKNSGHWKMSPSLKRAISSAIEVKGK
ncbi:hypothetical protein [Luteolibacter sp. Populi]|uniref:hypothetical protein n=1 Tax=Luteolibacter sp. Populi TaxID=3230487 RepID=UPI003467C33C